MSNAIDHDEDEVLMSADVHDHVYAASRLDLVPSADGFSITGIDPFGICGDGREIVIVNASTSHTVTIKNNDAGSTVGNRFFTADGSDVLLSPLGTPGGTTMVWGIRIENESGRVGWWMQV